jgi:hypothetical protein
VSWSGVGVPLGGSEPEPRQRLGEADDADDAAQHREARLALEIAREVGHAGAAEHDRFRPVRGQRATSASIARQASEPGSSRASTGASAARTFAQRAESRI